MSVRHIFHIKPWFCVNGEGLCAQNAPGPFRPKNAAFIGQSSRETSILATWRVA